MQIVISALNRAIELTITFHGKPDNNTTEHIICTTTDTMIADQEPDIFGFTIPCER